MEEWQQVMSSTEFENWKAFRRLFPYGPDRDNWRTAQLAATVANASGRYVGRLQPSDFDVSLK